MEDLKYALMNKRSLSVPLDNRWGVRADARWFDTFGKTPDRWRVYNGVTFGRAAR